ncbi:MAG: hypothetical protein D8M59_03325 [Planctomycetes bacterium]|nr:hypothetical protein [Planctomycetota bacterium]NOG53028.1 hypothetical protein [Planctomycetota bacterium]
MRNAYFTVSTVLAACSLTVLPAWSQESGHQRDMLEQGKCIQPLRVARIAPDGRQTSPWYSVGDSGVLTSGCPPTKLAFDCFEPDRRVMPGEPTDGAFNGGYDPYCGNGVGRYWSGSWYYNCYAANDMTCVEGTAGLPSERHQFAWFWQVEGPGTSEPCYVALWTAEDFDETCTGPAFSNLYSGIIWDFGVVPQCDGLYYWFDSMDFLCGTGLYNQLPMDGSGAYIIMLANDYNGTTLTMATCAQPMLWGCKDDSGSSQGPIQWNDDWPPDGEFRPGYECWDQGGWYCPESLGIMTCFYADFGPPRKVPQLSAPKN